MRLRYWDACAFLGWLRGEEDKAPTCRAVISEAQAGRVRIVTSTLTLPEVLWLKGKDPVAVQHRERIRAFFRHEWIVLIHLDRAIGELAQEVVWEHGIRPKDAVHVATALKAGVEQLDTFDQGLQRASGTLGHPPLSIGVPGIEGQLFTPPVQDE